MTVGRDDGVAQLELAESDAAGADRTGPGGGGNEFQERSGACGKFVANRCGTCRRTSQSTVKTLFSVPISFSTHSWQSGSGHHTSSMMNLYSYFPGGSGRTIAHIPDPSLS